MIQITPHMKIFLGVEPVDFRKGIDGLVRLCRSVFEEDPFAGYLFVFRNKNGTSLKIVVYDGQGFWLFQKRLSKGRFRWWPNRSDGKRYQLDVQELQHLIWNGDLEKLSRAPFWRKLS